MLLGVVLLGVVVKASVEVIETSSVWRNWYVCVWKIDVDHGKWLLGVVVVRRGS
jgi:hypothetical protein